MTEQAPPFIESVTQIVVGAYGEIPEDVFEEAKGFRSFFVLTLTAEEIAKNEIVMEFNLMSLDNCGVLGEHLNLQEVMEMMSPAVERNLQASGECPPVLIIFAPGPDKNCWMGCIEMTEQAELVTMEDLLASGISAIVDDNTWEVN